MKRLLPVICLALAAVAPLWASTWEGSAMMSAYGEFPDTGYYAACNSFPRNTAVEVVNLENGRSVTVIVTKGLDNPGIFLLLSPEAAKSLGMNTGMVSRVRVSSPRNIAETGSPAASSRDPDYNPSILAARSEKPEKAPTQEPAKRESAAAKSASESAPMPEPEKAVPEPKAETAFIPADSIEVKDVPQEVQPSAKESPIVRPEAIARGYGAPAPDRKAVAAIEPPEGVYEAVQPESAEVYGLSQPSKLEEGVDVALSDPALVPDELPEAALLRQSWPESQAPSVELADCEIRMEDTGKPEAVYLASTEPAPEAEAARDELHEPAEVAMIPAEREETKEAETPTAAEGESEIIVSLEPAEEKPPEAVKPATSVATVSEAKSAPKEPSTVVVPGKYYIQIGAYKSQSSLDAATRKLGEGFPVTVETSKSGKASVYRLFIGPLGRDETGVALVKIRSLGFKDAFLK